jgi:hypothetical protein
LSVEGSQARRIEVALCAVACRPCGAEGGVVSGGGTGFVTWTVTAADVADAPALSNARATIVYAPTVLSDTRA